MRIKQVFPFDQRIPVAPTVSGLSQYPLATMEMQGSFISINLLYCPNMTVGIYYGQLQKNAELAFQPEPERINIDEAEDHQDT